MTTSVRIDRECPGTDKVPVRSLRAGKAYCSHCHRVVSVKKSGVAARHITPSR